MKGEWRHICVDMQRMFLEDTPWHVAWMERVLPAIHDLCALHAERTIFTRFMPPESAEQATGTWREYYQKWWMMSGGALPPAMTELAPELAEFVPPARMLTKMVYSPWLNGSLHRTLREEGVETVVITGGETDVCVMATIFGAIDLGYRIILLKDALCSGADETHDASLQVMGERFSVQLEVTTVPEFLEMAAMDRQGERIRG